MQWFFLIGKSNILLKKLDDWVIKVTTWLSYRTSPGKSLVITHLSNSSLRARFSLKNFDENLLASSRIFSRGNEICEPLYRLYIPVTACVDCPAKQKNSPPFLKCPNTSVHIKETKTSPIIRRIAKKKVLIHGLLFNFQEPQGVKMKIINYQQKPDNRAISKA